MSLGSQWRLSVVGVTSSRIPAYRKVGCALPAYHLHMFLWVREERYCSRGQERTCRRTVGAFLGPVQQRFLDADFTDTELRGNKTTPISLQHRLIAIIVI